MQERFLCTTSENERADAVCKKERHLKHGRNGYEIPALEYVNEEMTR